MAILIHGPFGQFSGKVGNIVGVIRNGRQYIQRLPRKSNKPKTEKQLLQQAKFKLAVQFITPVKDVVNRSLRSKWAPYGYNNAVKDLLLNSLILEGSAVSINYPKVCFSKGSLSGPYHVNLTVENEAIQISWDTYPSPFDNWNDEVTILAYLSGFKRYLFAADDILRNHGRAFIPIADQNRGQAVHVYLFLRSQDGRYSNSVYAGEVNV